MSLMTSSKFQNPQIKINESLIHPTLKLGELISQLLLMQLIPFLILLSSSLIELLNRIKK
jgi:hypothetical protein